MCDVELLDNVNCQVLSYKLIWLWKMICRLCLCCEGNMNSILDPRLQLCDKIQRIASVKIPLTEELPVTVCNVCTEKVDAFYKFQQQIEKSYETLKQWVGDGVCKNTKTPLTTSTTTFNDNDAKQKNMDRRIEQNRIAKDNLDLLEDNKDIYLQGNLDDLELCTNLDQQVERAPRIVETLLTELPNLSSTVSKAKYICLICLKQVHPDDLEYHASTHFKDMGSIQNEAPFNCELCSETFEKRIQFAMHQRTHFKVKPFRCKNCNRKFGTFDLLNFHKSKEECNDDKLLPCEYCGSLFTERRDLIAHRNTHSEVQSLTCQLCHKHLSTKRSFHVHMKYHQYGRQFMCEICPKSYFTWSQLKLHLQTHKSTKSHLCCHCGKCFSSTVDLKRHMAYHCRAKTFKCNFCESEFYDNWKRNEHVKEKHENLIFICETCGILLYSKCGLQKHNIKNHPSVSVQEVNENTNNVTRLAHNHLNVVDPCLMEISNSNINNKLKPTIPSEPTEEQRQVHDAGFILITEQDNDGIVNEALTENDVALYILAGNSVSFSQHPNNINM